jgi:hypothetical protein
MVGNQQVYKTPSTNVAVAMANLDRFPDTPKYQDIRTNIRAHLIAAMGETATLLKRVQAVSYTEVISDQTQHNRTSPRSGGHHHSRSLTNNRRKDTRRDNCGRHTGSYHKQRRGRGQKVNQDQDLRYNISPKDVHEHINRRITERVVHENV